MKLSFNSEQAKDIWKQLYEFPMIERKGDTTIENILEEAVKLAG